MSTITSNFISQYMDYAGKKTGGLPGTAPQLTSVFQSQNQATANPIMDLCKQMNDKVSQLISQIGSAPMGNAATGSAPANSNQVQGTTQTNPFTDTSSGVTASAGNMPMTSKSNDARSKKYEEILKTAQIDKNRPDIAEFKKVFEQNKGKYEGVAKKLGVPDQLVPMVAKAIWAIHAREGSCDFTTYLHNGDKLGSPTKNVPAGINFSNWEDAAVDAMKRELPKMGGKIPQSVPEWCAFAELYNGTGYENKGVPSPYVLAGTNKYTAGKYVADGQYSATAVDKQPGFAALMLA